MDKATIEAMRKVVKALELTIEKADFRGTRTIATGGDPMPTELLREATAGFRTLVDQAEAEQPQAPAESDERELNPILALCAVVDAIDDLVQECDRTDNDSLLFVVEGVARKLHVDVARAAVLAINGLITPKPTTTGDPTIEECVAAINAAGGVAGITGWKIRVEAKGLETRIRLSLKEVKAMGRLLIDRERAEAAKGGSE